MKLQSLRVSEFKRFRAPFALDDLQPGLNIVAGPNEAGKSTLVRALRAAFFERHRSTSVDDLRPFGDAAATPTVELAFEIDGVAHRLTKSFLHRKRCELTVGHRRLEGVDAEDHLAERLGFRHAGRGVSREEHWGIPGLLWVEQGAGHRVREALGHAADHLRAALDASVAEVATEGGDEIVARAQRERDGLLTPSTARPRGEYEVAIRVAAEHAAEVAKLHTEVEQWRDLVDRLQPLRRAHAGAAAAQPWQALRQQQAQAQALLDASQALAAERDRARARSAAAQGLRRLLHEQLEGAEQQARALAAREAALAAAADAARQAHDAQAQVEPLRDAALARTAAAQRVVEAARRADAEAALQRQSAEAAARAGELAAQLDRAEAAVARAAALRTEADALRIEPDALQALRRHAARLHELDIRQAAVATRLRWSLEPGAVVDIDGQRVGAAGGGDDHCGTARAPDDDRGAAPGGDRDGERRLVAPTTVAIAGVGRLHITPGGDDLAALAQAHALSREALRDALARLGLATAADADARDAAHARARAQASAAEQVQAGLAPHGIDALRTALVAAQARQAQAHSALRPAAATATATASVGTVRAVPGDAPSDAAPAAPATPGAAADADLAPPVALSPSGVLPLGGPLDTSPAEALPPPTLADAERRFVDAQHAAQALQRRWQAARDAAAAAAGRRDAALAERDGLARREHDPAHQAWLVAKRRELAEAAAQAALAEAELAQVDARWQAARPDALRLDVERYARSAELAEREHGTREREIVQLEATLAAAGPVASEEKLAQARAELAQAERFRDQQRDRAAALDFLLQRLQSHRQALTRRLQAPLRRHLQRYVELLFDGAGAALEVDEQLAPTVLTRGGARGPEPSDVEALSHGAREQMGVVSRLACADLLRAAGRPTLVVLDDALVHSDAARLAQMKRVLLDAAQRHQLLLFTCHPENWRDMGVPLRALDAGAVR